MYKSSFRVCLFVIILMSSWATYAAGLGKLTLNSALGQPLKAEIDLVSVNNNEIPSLAARLASPEAFKQAGINYASFFSTFKISIEPRANGDPYIKITSQQSVNEPFLNMLMELSWSSGRLLREYTVLLDPVDTNIPDPVAPTFRPAPVAVKPTPLDTPADPVSQPIKQVDDSSFPASQPVIVEQAKDTYGPVSRGDTLSDIAHQVSPNGTDLDKMLVALYRANRDAFIEGNMNLLKVGVILRVPNSSEVAVIDKREAKAEIKVQVADWHSYRDKLAQVTGESQTQETRAQVDAGQITTTVGDETVAVQESPKEVLRLSGGEHDAQSEANNTTLARLRMMEEDSIARNLALKEANERVAMLEKSIENLQRLLELKDPVLAQAQTQAELAPETEAITESEVNDVTESESIAVTTLPSEPVSDLLADSTTEQESVVIPDLSVSDPVEKAVISPIQPAEAEVSWMDQLINTVMENIAYVGGALGFLMLGILGLFISRRRKAESEVDADDIDFDDLSSPAHNEMASVAATDSIASLDQEEGAQTDENTTLSEFDTVDLSQTEISETPEVADDDADKGTDFFPEENVIDDDDASEVSDTVADSLDNSEDMLQNSSEPSSEIELDLDDTSGETESNVPENEPESDIADDWSENPSESDNEIEFDLGDSADDQAPQGQVEKAESESASDQIESLTAPELPIEEAAEEAIKENVDLDATDLSDNSEASEETGNKEDYEFEIDLGDAEEQPNQPVSEENEALDMNIDVPGEAEKDQGVSDSDAAEIPSLSLDDIDLDMDDTHVPSIDTEEETNEAVTDPAKKSEHWQEVATKIDLAKAYQELDDKEGAKEILEEVMREGDAEQQETAKTILENL